MLAAHFRRSMFAILGSIHRNDTYPTLRSRTHIYTRVRTCTDIDANIPLSHSLSFAHIRHTRTHILSLSLLRFFLIFPSRSLLPFFSFSLALIFSVLHTMLTDILSHRVNGPRLWRLPRKRCLPRSPTNLS